MVRVTVLPLGPSNVTCLLAESMAMILPWTVMMVSAAIPVTRLESGGAAVSDGVLAGGELCVLAHPAKVSTNVTNTANPSLALFLVFIIGIIVNLKPLGSRLRRRLATHVVSHCMCSSIR